MCTGQDRCSAFVEQMSFPLGTAASFLAHRPVEESYISAHVRGGQSLQFPRLVGRNACPQDVMDRRLDGAELASCGPIHEDAIPSGHTKLKVAVDAQPCDPRTLGPAAADELGVRFR